MKKVLVLMLLLSTSDAFAKKKVVNVGKAKFSIEEVSSSEKFDPGKNITLKVLDQTGKVIRVEKFKSGPSLGGYTGVNIPNDQPFARAFIFSIDGGYDSKLFICFFDKKCEGLPDGSTFVDKSKQQLLIFKGGGTEGGALSIYSLKKKDTLSSITDWKAVEKFIDQESYSYTAYTTGKLYILVGKAYKKKKEAIVSINTLSSKLNFLKSKPKEMKPLDDWSSRVSSWTRLQKM